MATLGPASFKAAGGETSYPNPFSSAPASVTVNGTPITVGINGAYITFAALTAGDVVVITPTASDNANMELGASANVDIVREAIFQPVQIANGQSLSSVVDLGGYRIKGIITDSAWTAAAITFKAGDSAASLSDSWDNVSGAEVSIASGAIAVAAKHYIRFSDSLAWEGIQFLQLRSGVGATPVAQGALRTLTLVLSK